MAETDPKSVQDLTNVVQTLLQQMQDKFQTMSDQIIGRNILKMFRQALRRSRGSKSHKSKKDKGHEGCQDDKLSRTFFRSSIIFHYNHELF
ncbi:hypothetical protein J4Q44_G00093880 [Coregonus suidteri]|uniref:Heat shock factor-binding protein 1 n=1 Tax=Coregonus suidteri TaxID=861788 RepID=A0AAN8MYP0_9TELE